MHVRQKRGRHTHVLIIIAAALVVFGIAGFLGGPFDVLSRAFISPAVSAVGRIGRAAANFLGTAGGSEALRQENARLLSATAELEMLERQNDALTQAIGLGKAIGRKTIPAANAGFFRFFGNEILVIDRGKESGVTAGDPVMTADNIYVGRVIAARSGEADVLLVTSASQSTDVLFVRTGVRARATGVSGRELFVDLVPQDAPIQAGDVFVVSPKAGDPASSLLVGEARTIASSTSPVFKDVRALHAFDPFGNAPLFVILAGTHS